MKTTYRSLFFVTLGSSIVGALPAISPDTPIPLNALKLGYKGSNETSFGAHGLTPEIIRALVERGLQTPQVEQRSDFDAKSQLIDVHGEHEFVPPDFDSGDVRGLCPGLNTLANHGYLPHNGVATWLEYVTAVGDVWGMQADLAGLLTTLGVVLGGDLVSVSQGGPSKYLQSPLPSLLGEPRGLSGCHPLFDVDGSPTRGDIYDPIGDNNNMNFQYFMELYNLQKDEADPNYSIEVLFEHNRNRWHQVVGFNPYFYAGPASGWMVRASPYCFIARLASNHSAEYPDGRMDKESLKTFFAVFGDDDHMEYKIGYETIPEHWYRRSQTTYGILALALDIVTYSQPYPEILSIGGNTNGVNTFTGIDLSDLSGGLLNAENLLEGNHLLCFALNMIKSGTPNMLSNFWATVEPAAEMIFAAIDPVIDAASCPQWKDLAVGGVPYFDYIQKTYPGAKRSGGSW